MGHSKKGIVISGIVLLLLILFPPIAGTEHTLNLFIILFIVTILSQSWNMLAGYAGQVSLGNAAFFGVGGLVFHFLGWRAGLPLFVALPLGGIAAVLMASVIGIPALRLKGVYFAIGTLALSEALKITVGNVFPLTAYIPTQYITSYKLSSRYYLALFVVVLTQAVAYWMVRSKIGLAMRAIRDDEEAADTSGVNLFKYKFIALVFSSFFSGLAGGIFAYYETSIVPNSLFGPQWTFEPLVAASVGGAGTLLGPLIGSVFLIILMEIFALALGKGYLIIFGTLFIVVVLFFPSGLVEISRRMRRLFAARSVKMLFLTFLILYGVCSL
jgi:branched-chain amino acid transport system permease protein